jgi:beta-glucanase (GH16 family)
MRRQSHATTTRSRKPYATGDLAAKSDAMVTRAGLRLVGILVAVGLCALEAPASAQADDLTVPNARASNAAPARTASVPGFTKLTFASEFGSGVNETIWRVRSDTEGTVTYRPRRLRVSNGALVIEGKPKFWWGGKYYGGGMVAESSKFGPGHLFEFRMRIEGAARWNLAGWTFGGDPWPRNGEIDTVELISRGNGRAFPLQSLHGPGSRGLIANNSKMNLELDGRSWHTFAHLWEGDTVIFFIDGKEIWRRQLTDAGDKTAFQSFYPIISFYSGGWVGNARGGAKGYVDFVRVWAR